jgi:hypothetical protein
LVRAASSYIFLKFFLRLAISFSDRISSDGAGFLQLCLLSFMHVSCLILPSSINQANGPLNQAAFPRIFLGLCRAASFSYLVPWCLI